jgi:predicted SnoaL-like aldol condensation-catalyzing enzyme
MSDLANEGGTKLISRNDQAMLFSSFPARSGLRLSTVMNQPLEISFVTQKMASTSGMRPREVDAVAFLQLASCGKMREACDRYVGSDFRHHDPCFQDNAKSLAAGREENAIENPEKRLEILRTIELEDQVVVHSHVQMAPGGPAIAWVHIFRFEDGRIAELWNVGQEA